MARDFELALISARGGSKGLPGKNLRPLAGIPMITWTIRAALESEVFENVVVSTDSPEIARVASQAGAAVPFMRPAELASDTAASDAVIAHALEELGTAGNFALLQPTSPFRTDRHIVDAAGMFMQSKASIVIGVTNAKPVEWLFVQGEDGFLYPAVTEASRISRRQDTVTPVVPNGSLYMTSVDAFMAKKCLPTGRRLGFLMSAIHSLDIDNLDDFRLAEALVSEYGPELNI